MSNLSDLRQRMLKQAVAFEHIDIYLEPNCTFKNQAPTLEQAIKDLHEMALDIINYTNELKKEETPKKFSEWGYEDGDVMWWEIPIAGPPEYIGSPTDSSWPWEEEDEEKLCWMAFPNPRTDRPE